MARTGLRPPSALRLRANRPDKATKTEKAGKTAKADKSANASKATKATKSGKTGKTAKAERGSRSTRSKRHSVPFPLRLLAMLCAFAVMVAFAVVLARLTLEPSPASEALTHTNMRPGRSLRAYLDQPALRDAVKQIGGNLLLGVPFGVLVPVVAPRTRGILRVLLLTATVMLLVEFAQGALITGRAFDIDDVILNTTGALVGYLLLGRRMSRAVHS
ncbi:membrane protein [Streptomyces sp. MMG1533]|uniref:VanZ family protein n=1 Tax=Streptomyces sp. MMG1533 TaxID=1415546 RepID=UPI0006AE831A|nr:VanZ family protein [Streptomyces sp. MMG1533]KOU61753.1 membrane protein [Streptomyces sp. MMG1533]